MSRTANPAQEALRRVIMARYPVTQVVTFEEDRVEANLRHLTQNSMKRAGFWVWACTTGLEGPEGPVADTRDPERALDVIMGLPVGVFLFRDLHAFFGQPAVVRKLRDVRLALTNTPRFLFLTAPRVTVPLDLRRDVAVMDFPMPTAAELGHLLDRYVAGFEPVPDDDTRLSLVTALRGLTVVEASNAMNMAFYGKKRVDDDAMTTLHAQKAQLARKDGVLEFVAQKWHLDDIGGLEVLKQWFVKRRTLFEDEEADRRGLAPRGVLVMGIPGCGKSMCIKAAAALWGLPLFRLEMAQVFSGVYGTPEETFDHALKMMEAVAPAILWIDEIENAISADAEGADAGTKGRIFATFLTWMQEKPAQVFVGATANRIDLLPAELLRKGRFDQVFFIDLPDESERAAIFDVHLRHRKVDLTDINVVTLAKATKNWNGAEIENAVVAAMIEAYDADREVTEDDIFFQVGKVVPLAVTMSEQIKAIKSWAGQRAIRAS